MKLSFSWLSDFVDFSEKDPHKIAEALTLGTAEVEEVEVQGELLDHCCVGKVLTVENHPNADKLKLCDTETDKGKKRVVCGGANLRVGMLVAFAHCGAKVKWHGEELMELKKVKIRGEESEGMICAAEELQLSVQFPESTGHNIIDMGDSEYEVGKSLKDALGLGDTVFHIDNHSITHRADLFSHVGFARECIALGLGKWKKKPSYSSPSFARSAIPFKCKIDVKELVPRYLACTLEIENTGETPDWMKRRLFSIGIRSLNLPVDITNYVTAEVGMPLHSFDLDDLKGDVHFRTTKKGEKIITLDSQERVLPQGAIVLSDSEGIFDLMGVMGGLRSSTKETTRNIYLHSAIVDPVSIRNTIVATGLRTDASTVYEKGIPYIMAEQGFYRALELLLELVPGAQIVSCVDSYGDNGKPDSINFSLSRTATYLGREIPLKEAEKVLTALDFSVKKKGDSLVVTPPLHRLGDISNPVDVMEEIARISGFVSFEEEFPSASITPPQRDQRVNLMRDSLQDAGFTELVQFSFLGEELLKKSGFSAKGLEEIENPLGEDLKYLRSSLTPRLLEFVTENLLLFEGALRVFEVGHVFSEKDEHKELTLLVAQKQDTGIKNESFLQAKDALLEALDTLNISCSLQNEKNPSIERHPVRNATLLVGKKQVGELYEVHPAVAKNFAPCRISIATLYLDSLLSLASPERLYQNVSEFPSIIYDTTVSLGSTAKVESLLKKVQGSHELLRDVHLTDLYQKGNERQLTFRCTYGAFDRTLTEEEVKPVHEKVEAKLRS